MKKKHNQLLTNIITILSFFIVFSLEEPRLDTTTTEIDKNSNHI